MPRITDVKGMTVYANFPWNFVRIYTDDSAGLYGTGECFLTPGFDGILRDLAPLLLGRDISRPKQIIAALISATSGAGSTGGLVINVITGIEAALLDAYGKALGVPISQLLGGRVRDSVRVYADCHAGTALEALNEVLQPMTHAWAPESEGATEGLKNVIDASASRAKHMVTQGYDFLKFDLDIPGSTFDAPLGQSLRPRQVGWMIDLIHAIREAVGSDVDIAFDAHWRYTPKDMLILCDAVAGAHLAWLEDPVPPTDLQGLDFIRSRTKTPVATGENHQLLSGFFDLLSGRACDVVTPDLQKAGGLFESVLIAGLSERMNVPMAPHMIGSPVAMMTTAQFSSTVPSLIAMEFHGADVPFYGEIVSPSWDEWYSPGSVTLLERPGIGVELESSVARRYARAGSPVFQE